MFFKVCQLILNHLCREIVTLFEEWNERGLSLVFFGCFTEEFLQENGFSMVENPKF